MIRLLLKSLQRNFRESRTLFLFTVVGVALGVASVVAIQTLNQGAMKAFDGSVRAISGQADLSVLGVTPAFEEEALVTVLADPAVASAWPLCRVDVAVQGRPGLLLEVVGVDLLAPVRLPLDSDTEPGRAVDQVIAALTTAGWVAVTPSLAQEQGWAVGDTIIVSSGSRTADLVLGALVDFQSLEPLAPRTLAVMDIAQVQARLARPGLIHQIDVQLREGRDPGTVAGRLNRSLGAGLKVVTPEQRSQDAAGLLAAFRLNLTALSLISVFVGVFLVLTTVQASLSRRRSEFGLLRCLGARPGQVVGLIVAETTVLGALGVAAGIPLGYWVALENINTVSATLTSIYVLQSIDNLILPPQVVWQGIGVGLLGAVAGALWPAVEMARRDTVYLLGAVNLQEQTGRAVGRLTWVALGLALAGTLWLVLFGAHLNWGGFVYAGLMMVALPLIVPLTEAGWCVLSNGAGYLANLTKMPGVSVDMINWWFGWHGLEPLRYKIWYPQDHYHVSISDEHRKIILDPKTPAEKRFQGITHTVIESIGSGAEKIFIHFLPPEDFGFDMERFKSPAVGTFVGGNVFIKSSFFMPKVPVVMCHFIREIEGGIEFRSRFWQGYTIKNKKPKCKLPPFVKVPGKMLKEVGKHNVYEYTNLASFLPQLYEEQEGVIA